MPVIVACPCGKQLSINESLAGKKVKCPGCGNVFIAPGPSDPQPAPPPPRPAPSNPPPPAKPRRRRPLNPDGELSFDCPSIRAERLRVMTGGEEPVEMFNLGKTILTRAGSQVNWFVDVIVCDVGLLVVPYSHHNPAQHTATTIHFGLIGAAVGAVASSIAYNKASKAYADQAEQTDDWDPADLFAGVTKDIKSGGRTSSGPKLAPQEQMGAEFLPADEIESWKTPNAKTLEIKWRNRVFKFVRPDDADSRTKRDWDRLRDELDEWQEKGSAELEQRTGGPDQPGLAALLEWGHRPVGDVPDWVTQAVADLADSDLSVMLKKFVVPWETMGRLAGKLTEVPGGDEIARQLHEANAKKATPLLVSSVLTTGVGVAGLGLSLVVTAAEAEEGFIAISWVVTVVVLIVALILWLMWWDVSGGFKKGLKAVGS
jgi:hypothetical protein